MLWVASKLVAVVYLAAPLVAVALVVRDVRRAKSSGPAWRFVALVVWAAVLGVGLTVIYGLVAGARVTVGQAALTSYFALGLLLVLRAFAAGLDWALLRATRRLRRGRPGASVLATIVRTALLVCVGLPYVMAAVMTYRPKVMPRDDPQRQLGFAYESVTFRATDGTRVAGWWIPSQREGTGDRARRTVVVCHGLGASKSNQLVMARELMRGGWNVLAIDLRAHGESGGQLCTFGDRERLDVLAAVRWVRDERPGQAERIFGVGASMGAAALVAAAADPSPDGQHLDAIAVYGTYDDLRSLTRTASQRFPPPLGWLLRHLGLPMASVQTGVDLAAFVPAELVAQVWPRPVLVIHGVHDEVIDFEHGRRLYNAALQPKGNLWIDRADHNSVVNDEAAAKAVAEFFDGAASVI